MIKFNPNPKILYITTIIVFAFIILFFTAIFPQSLDEFRFYHDTFAQTLTQIKITLTTDSPRFMVIPYIFLVFLGSAGKIIFTVLNPFVQLFVIFGLFFVITGRKINFNTKEDFYPFLLLCLMYLMILPNPADTLFWMSGAFCYSWAIVPVLILLCLIRKTIDGQVLKSTVLKNILMLFIGFMAGMSNENTGPMTLGISFLFLLYCKYKKIKVPVFYYYALAGICFGLAGMFGSGAGLKRLHSYYKYSAWIELPLFNKFFVFLYKIHSSFSDLYWLPIIILFGYFLVLYDIKLKIFKNKNFLIGLFFCLCGFVLSFVLFLAPAIGPRVFYSAAIFFFISFISLLLVIYKLYKINFCKYLSLVLFIWAVVWAPLITIPYIHLCKENIAREKLIAQAVKQNKKEVYVNRLTVLKGPNTNHTIYYYDILFPSFNEELEKRFKIKLLYENLNSIALTNEPI